MDEHDESIEYLLSLAQQKAEANIKKEVDISGQSLLEDFEGENA